MIFSKINNPYFFTFLKTRKLFSTYSMTDQINLSQEEVNQILKKNSAKKTVMIKQEQKKSTIYDKDIKEQIQQIQTLSQLQNKLKNQEENQHIQESAHHHIEPKRFKYELPIPNIIPEYPRLPSIFDSNDQNVQTINMKIQELLQLNENNSYEQYELELRNKFNLAKDMYGGDLNEKQDLVNQIQLLQEMAIPMAALDSELYMERMNRCVTLNLNLPGTIENEHPHKFLKDLKPVEEFRHTPLIPISEKQMKDFQLRVLSYHRKGFYFEMKSETIYNYIFIFMCLIIGFQMIKMVLNREEQQGIALERLKIKREQN